MNIYGLRRARTILRQIKIEVKGDTLDVARGWRNALNRADRVIADEMAKLKKEAANKGRTP